MVQPSFPTTSESVLESGSPTWLVWGLDFVLAADER